jgi:glycyl-tRNA synthetase (class II)
VTITCARTSPGVRAADADEVKLADLACPNCGNKGTFTEPRMFNGLLKTYLGPVESEEGLHYLRPRPRRASS